MTDDQAKCSVLQRATRSQICLEPFPHLVLRNALDTSYYAALAQEFPDLDTLLAKRRLQENGQCYCTARMALSNRMISGAWHNLVSYHVSQDFFQEVSRLFGNEIRALHPDLETRLGKRIEDLSVVKRQADSLTEGDIRLECQFVYNAPGPARVIRGPHLDRAVALYAGLLYFRLPEDVAEGGDLDLYRYSPKDLPKRSIERVKTIEYDENTLVIFVNSLCSIHAVSPRAASTFPRLHINLFGELKLPLYSEHSMKQRLGDAF